MHNKLVKNSIHLLLLLGFIATPSVTYSQNRNISSSKYITDNQVKDFAFNYQKLNNNIAIVPIAIIGGGPAGLSAGIVTSQEFVKTVIFEGKHAPGGPLNAHTPVGNWPAIYFSSGKRIISDLYRQVKRFDKIVALVQDDIQQVDFTNWPFALRLSNNTKIYAASVIIATGSSPRVLNIPGESQYLNQGVYFDIQAKFGTHVIVVGGGDDAVRKVNELSKANKDVTLIVRGNALKAAKWRQNSIVKNNKVKIIYNKQITEVLGTGPKMTGVRLSDNSIVNADAVLLAIGRLPNSEFLADQVILDQSNYILLRPTSHATNIEGVFAAGEVVKPGQAIMAAADGTSAAYEALEFLKKINYAEKFSA
jgi:thioredoxin reductase (NADPH)